MFEKIQYISQGITVSQQRQNINRALDAGCTWIQLRFKHATEREFLSTAEQMKKLCSGYQAKLIINDRVTIAKQIDADGVHLGLDDMAIQQARNILGTEKIIGGTANTLHHILTRVEEQCDYIGLGPFRFTTTKEALSPVIGLQGYEAILKEMRDRSIYVPVYAIGGILRDDIDAILKTGVRGVAISGAITDDANAREWINNF